ncbi:MAG TPA: 2'-5' RNA ligase family protein [Pedobacter sp.]|nr:2'-5' RNA ligase family protein [Pedobacter sp.]
MESLFFVAILPPPQLSEAIDNIRKQCSIDYDVFSALKPPVDITLAPPFKINPTIEKKMIASLRAATDFLPFISVWKNFDIFPRHTLYITGEKNNGVISLHRMIKICLRPYLKETYGSINLHITIAYRVLHSW